MNELRRRLWWLWLIVCDRELFWPAVPAGVGLCIWCVLAGEVGIACMVALGWACLWWPEAWEGTPPLREG